MKKPEIILLRGKAQVGKSTTANVLQCDYGYLVDSFAYPIHLFVTTMMGRAHWEVPGSLKNVPQEVFGGKTPRQVMQSLGTEWGRDMVYQKIWTTRVINRIRPLVEEGYVKFVISDYRFDNEYSDLVEAFGSDAIRVFHIVRPTDESGMDEAAKSHASENGIKIEPKNQVVIENSGTIEEFFSKIEALVKA